MELIFKVNIFWKRWLPLSFTVLHVLGEWLVLPPIIIGVPWTAHSDPSSLEPFLTVGFAASNQPSRWRKCLLLRQIAGWLIVCYKKKRFPKLRVPFLETTCCRCSHPSGPICITPAQETGTWETDMACGHFDHCFCNKVFQNWHRSHVSFVSIHKTVTS